jgi:hypothetical protein
MRWLAVVLVLLVPSVTFAAGPPEAGPPPEASGWRLELGGSVGLPSGDLGGRDAHGVHAGALYQAWRYHGFSFEAYHYFLDVPEFGHGLHTYDLVTASARLTAPIGRVRLFLAPGAGVAIGRYVTGDLHDYDRVEQGLALALRSGVEVAIDRHFVVGTAAHFMLSVLDGEYGPEGNLGVELYGCYQF